MALRNSSNAADVCFEHKLCCDYAKLNVQENIRIAPVRYAPVEQIMYASANTVATRLRRGGDVISLNPIITGWKRQSAQEDPDQGVRKRLRRMNSSAVEES